MSTTTPIGSTSAIGLPQANTASTASSATDKLANEQTFLQLFVSQLKNQDPLNPADGTQFVTQLAQFSQLEQTINIGKDVSAIRQQVAPNSSNTNSSSTATQGS